VEEGMNVPLLAALFSLYVFFLFILWKKRIWILYYLAAAFGFSLAVIGTSLNFGFEKDAERVVMATLQALWHNFDGRIALYSETALLIPDPTGWSILSVNVECSALIEISVVAGLTLFYPGFSLRRKIASAIVGSVLTSFSNLLRLSLIVLLVYTFGKPATFFAHAYIGRLFFLSTVILIYWYLFTRPTLAFVSQLLSRVPRRLRTIVRGKRHWKGFLSELDAFRSRLASTSVLRTSNYSFLLTCHAENLRKYRNLITRYKIPEEEKEKALDSLEYCSDVLSRFPGIPLRAPTIPW
jgi:exosortase family protein XrtG